MKTLEIEDYVHETMTLEPIVRTEVGTEPLTWFELFCELLFLCPPRSSLAASSIHLSWLRRRAFMKKLPTVLNSSPSCCEIVICISFEGRLVSLKIACRVRRWRSVKTNRGFFGWLLDLPTLAPDDTDEADWIDCGPTTPQLCCSSLRLQATSNHNNYNNG